MADGTMHEQTSATDQVVGRRRFLQGTAVAGATLLASSVLPPPPALARGRNIQFGAGCEPRGGEDDQRDAVLSLERKIDRKLGIMRRYVFWDGGLPDATHRWASDGGRTPYIAWHAYTRGGRPIPWRSIARGDHDSFLRTKGQALRRFRDPIYFNFHHEPENDPRNGSAADFRAAFNRVRSVFEDEGAHNLKWMVTLMASTYGGGHGGAAAWLPRRFDLVGVDGYNRYPVERSYPWRSFKEIFRPARALAQRHDKGLFIGEYGCVEDGPGDKAGWFDEAAHTMRSWSQVKAAVYSHRQATAQIGYWADSSRSSIRAFRAMGHRPAFRFSH